MTILSEKQLEDYRKKGFVIINPEIPENLISAVLDDLGSYWEGKEPRRGIGLERNSHSRRVEDFSKRKITRNISQDIGNIASPVQRKTIAVSGSQFQERNGAETPF